MSVAEHATLRSVLRASTADVHERLERIPAFERLLQGRASLTDYADVLRGHRRFYRHAQAHLDVGYLELAALGHALPRRDALSLLEHDLTAIGATFDDVTKQPALRSTPTTAVGWVWVVEGSALGGRVIDRALTRLLGEGHDGRRFFQPSTDMAARWQRVCAALERQGQHVERRDAIVAGARDAFACIERSLRDATR